MSIRDLLSPSNCTLLLIDHHPQLAESVTTSDSDALKRNVMGLVKAAAIFGLPVLYSSIKTANLSGEIWPEILDFCPNLTRLERSAINCWEDKSLVEAIEETRRKKLIIAGLWTETHVTFPTLHALAEGYEVYVVADASGSSVKENHDISIMRMMQAGAVPVTWQQVVHELQRDWAHEKTYDAVVDLIWSASGVAVET